MPGMVKGATGRSRGVVHEGELAGGEAEKGGDGCGIHGGTGNGGDAFRGAGESEVFTGDAGIHTGHGFHLLAFRKFRYVGHEKHGNRRFENEVLREFLGSGDETAIVTLLGERKRMRRRLILPHTFLSKTNTRISCQLRAVGLLRLAAAPNWPGEASGRLTPAVIQSNCPSVESLISRVASNSRTLWRFATTSFIGMPPLNEGAGSFLSCAVIINVAAIASIIAGRR